MLLAANRSTIAVTGPEQVSELCSTTVHCNIAGEPSAATVLDRVADGAGTGNLNSNLIINIIMPLLTFFGLSIFQHTFNSEVGSI